MEAHRKPKCLYILQIKPAKLCKESMVKLKCLLFEIIHRTQTQHLVLEVFFDEAAFFPLEDQIGLIVKMLVNAYNLLEPEHSRHFPLFKLEILLPQLFSVPSVLLTDTALTHVYYNEATNPALVESLLNERLVDQTLEPILEVTKISEILE